MSEQTPYQKLEVSEDASFEEIQSSRDRLVALYNDNEQSKQDVEVAYDAILMDRLRRRQTGEIKVPERIRFAEQLAEKKAAALPPKLTVPMMVCFLPALFCVILGPALIRTFATFAAQ